MSDLHYKTTEQASFKYSDAGPGTFSGYCAVFGNVDLQGDRLVQGSCMKHLPALVKRGYVGWQHGEVPVGTLKSAREDAHGVLVQGEFHTDAESQRIRRIVKERIERGHEVGMSIGYKVISARKARDARELTEVQIHEASLLSGLAANPQARVAEAKSGGSMSNAILESEIHSMRNEIQSLQIKARNNSTWSKALISSTQFKEACKWGKSVAISVPALQFKAAGDPVAALNPIDFAQRIDPHAFPPGGVLQLLRQTQVQTPQIVVSQATYPITNTAAFIAEGAAKPEMQPRWSSSTVTLEEVAAWCAVTRQAIEDIAGLASTINVDLQAALTERVADRVINGTGTIPDPLGILATPNVQTVAFAGGSTILDMLYKGVNAVETPGYGVVSAIVMNPADYIALLSSKISASGAYVVAPRIADIVVRDAHLAAGTALVGDWRFAQLYTRGTVRIEAGYKNDDLLKNQMTLAPSWRVAVALSRPQAFAKVALA